MNKEQQIEEALQEYKRLLKFCNPKKCDEAPDNLLELLNEAHRKLHEVINS